MAESRRSAPGLRTAMAVAGVLTLAFYAAASVAVYRIARVLWVDRPDVATLAAVFLVAALVSGYLTYRLGSGRALTALDARELPRGHAPGVHRLVDGLAAAMDVERPRVLVARLGAPNALAVGGRPPALVVDYTLFRLLSPAEMEGVLAHELAHLEGRDGLVQTLGHSVVNTAVGVVALALAPVAVLAGGFARGLALVRGDPAGWHRTLPGRLRVLVAQTLTLLWIGLSLLLRAYSRQREHAADDRAVEVTGRPLALARALRTLDRANDQSLPLSPLYQGSGTPEGALARLLSTHPPMDERIERLRRRAARAEGDRRERRRAATDRGAGGRGRPGREPVPERGLERDRGAGHGAGRGPPPDEYRPGRPNRDDDGWTRIPIRER